MRDVLLVKAIVLFSYCLERPTHEYGNTNNNMLLRHFTGMEGKM